MNRNKLTAGVSMIALIMSLTACADKEAVSETPVIGEEIVQNTEAAEAANTTQEEIFGIITNISENEITIAVMTPAEEAPTGDKPEGMPQKPEGEATAGMPQKPEGEAPEGMPQKPSEGDGEERVIQVTEHTQFVVDGKEAAITDLQEGDTTVILIGGEAAVSIEVMQMQPQDMPADGGMNQETAETRGTAEFTEETVQTGTAFDSEEADVSAVVVKEGGKLSLSSADIHKSGDTSDHEASEFYGLNAAILVKSGSSATINDSSVITDALGANAVFATGEDAAIEVSNVVIETGGDSSRGLDATYGGTIIADSVSITTKGAHCAALATDRGEGTVKVTEGNLQTSGEGSPCIYSTGAISVSDSKGLASGSAIAVVEGKNSIDIQSCTLEGYGIGRAGGGIDDAGVMIYQSMSGDAGEGTGSFTAANSSLTISEESDKYVVSPMFFVTNTEAVINLTNTELNFGSGILLSASGNDGEWGKEGENGGDVQMNVTEQTLRGDIVTDDVSSAALVMTDSTLEGCINHENMGDVTLVLDSGSTWTVTGDSYVSVLSNEDESCANINSNGYRVYYDADNSVNDWLKGAVVSLSGGGMLMPAN